jgi:serine/threonine protein phosphatase 1
MALERSAKGVGLFGWGAKRRSSASPPSTGGPLIYAIGDIHGRLDLLEDLLGQIARDMAATPSDEKPVLVFLGDYVDRGAYSRGVIECAMRICALENVEVRALKGNHEQAMLAFLANPEFGPTWLQNGGAATLVSYGVAAPQARTTSDLWTETRDALERAMPPGHLAFLQNLELCVEYGDYIFVHAGLRPGVPIERQTEQDMLWIRNEFLEERRPFSKMVVHGHTPEPEPYAGPVRMGLDTGAYATGVLTAARLFGQDRRFIQASAHGDPLAVKAS